MWSKGCGILRAGTVNHLYTLIISLLSSHAVVLARVLCVCVCVCVCERERERERVENWMHDFMDFVVVCDSSSFHHRIIMTV